MKKKVYIEGMSCNNCVRHVHEALIQIDGVQDAQVSLEKKCAEIELTHEVDDKLIKKAVEEAGYEVTGIE
ncbi:copper chaperone CopZ [Thermoclostridium stercorarium subsp. stercorarium DSM 8532]|uniref:Copper chaperone CopZ n=2 Tax=Thermoclostridium stercorarium TaxID=1510 RepID=L7VMR8_THES1|nr:heavy metal-associated domain-containing protein [Thermoclostridium stercorarium]AGC67949.1 copper chaperone CopZ [Thermoclostridium stercorarium subsp. stercorarium DSM 8532]AGI38986.1 transporter ATPase subunit [Thermoclostridium stercorarium subsp. stercorarium DSM 8532]ANX00880.1 heavy metal transport/detoxification protein [Thermoclostridium stercorarium subsp. leptospartum DSM 9219]